VRAHEIRQLSDQELVEELGSFYREILNLRFRLATKQMNNTSQVGVTKKNIARLQTIMRERKQESG
jgi:large subunit ribosomal protein L29